MGSPLLIKLDSALSGVTKLGFDTPPFIYFVERHSAYIDVVRAILQKVDAGVIEAYSSVITLLEVLTQPKRMQNTTVEAQYRDLLLNSRNLTLLPIDALLAEAAADLRARYQLKTPDALQVAAALQANCEAFLTNDTGLKRVAEVRVLILDELEL
jgi:predicted nucleic acid-binding protein